MNDKGMTVRELLQLPLFKEAKLIGGEKGLDRIVRYVDILEVPDAQMWLREGELIVTTGYPIRHDPSLFPQLVEQLAQVNAAALAIKPERFIPSIPQEMIDKGNLHNLPIIQIPIGMSYIDITNAVMEQILDKQAALLRRSEEVYKILTNLVLANSGIQVVADNVAELVQSPIWVIERSGDVLVSSPTNIPYHPEAKTLRWDITVDKTFMGKLIVEKEQLDDLERVCIEQARLVFSLELMRRKTAHDTEARLRGNFFEELLIEMPLSRAEAENKGRQLGLQPEWQWEVCIIEGPNQLFDDQSPFVLEVNERVFHESRKRNVRSHVQKHGERLVLLLSTKKAGEMPKKRHTDLQDTSEWIEILSPMLGRWINLRIGFGSKCSLWDVHRSYVEAKKTILIGSRLDKAKHIFTFEQFEMFHLLLESQEYVDFDRLIEKKIGKLAQYDKENESNLVTTLYHYLATGGSLIETANRLYIHRNSVKYRMDRIKEIAEMDLEDTRSRFMYYLCTSFYLLNKTD